jgi:hypothetical protein
MSTIGAVTGRQYTKTRVRGFAEWNPAEPTLVIIEQVKAIIIEYSIALTIRQIFYRLVGKYQYEKTERAYDRLGEYLNRARRAGLIKLNAIRDDGDIVPSIPGYTGVDDFWETVKAWAEDYFVTPDGDSYVEVWVETAGMVPQIQSIADSFGVRVVGAGGFDSLTAKINAAIRLRSTDKPVHILLIGDYDPSGQAIMDAKVSDIIEFGAAAEFERLAVTPEQAEQYNLISAPQKDTDKRGEYMAETYQAEALDPDVLAEIVRSRLAELIGDENVTETETQTKIDREQIVNQIERRRRRRKK